MEKPAQNPVAPISLWEGVDRLTPCTPGCVLNPCTLHCPTSETPNGTDSMLTQKVQYMVRFLHLLIPDMTGEEEQVLSDALFKTYNDFGITHDNNSLFVDANAYARQFKEVPTLDDVHKHLLDNPKAARIAAIVSTYSAELVQDFNQKTICTEEQ